jgi:biotin operon repressor
MTIVQDVLQISKAIFDLDADVEQKRKDMADSRAEFEAFLNKAQSEIDAVLKIRAKHVISLEALLVSSPTNLTQPERVLRFLKQHDEFQYSADELADELDINVNSVRAVLSQLRADGQIDSPERGFYTYNTPLPPPSVISPASAFGVASLTTFAEDSLAEEDGGEEIPFEEGEGVPF